MVLNVHRNHKAYWGRGDGGKGNMEVGGGGGKGRLYTYRYTVATRMTFCSDESHFNVSVGSDGQSHTTVSTDHNL